VTEIQGEKFYEVELSYRPFEKLFPDEFPFIHFWYFKILEYYRPRLILPFSIRDYAANGVTNEIKPFIFKTIEQENNTYIDNDRIGLRIR
jgi:hypothetical protein